MTKNENIKNELKTQFNTFVTIVKQYIDIDNAGHNVEALGNELNDKINDITSFVNAIDDIDITNDFLEILSSAITAVDEISNDNDLIFQYNDILNSCYETLLQRSNSIEYNFSKS